MQEVCETFGPTARRIASVKLEMRRRERMLSVGNLEKVCGAPVSALMF